MVSAWPNSGALRLVARPPGGTKRVSGRALRLLDPFNRCSKRNAAETRRYRDGRLERVVARAGVVAHVLGPGHDAIAMPVREEKVLVLVSVAQGFSC